MFSQIAGKRPRSDGSGSDSGSSSDSSSDDDSSDDEISSVSGESSSDESDVGILDQAPPAKKAKIVPSPLKDPISTATKKVDRDILGATCKHCQGNYAHDIKNRNYETKNLRILFS